MEDNKLIAQALLEIAQRSTTTFLEVGKGDKELIEAAKKIGIALPSPDLLVMKTVYAEINKVNKNGIILPKKAVEKGLNTLIGKQCNWEHNGSGFVCGYTISAKIKETEIETINVLFKSLFPEQSDELKEKVKSGDAAVSFEIWNKDPETQKSVVKELTNGFKEISPIIFHGTGILLAHQPACPKAKIFKLIATKELLEAEKIVDKAFEPNLIYAQLAIEEPKCNNCGKCPCGKKVKVVIKQIESKEWICPHCEKTIGEKELFLDEKTSKWYHRPCQEKGEIILPEENLNEKEERKVAEKPKTEIKAEETKTQKTVVVETKPAAIKKEVTSEIKTEKPVVEKKEDVKVEKKDVKVEKKEDVKVEKKDVKVEKKEGVKADDLETIVPKIVIKVTRISRDIHVDTYKDGTPSGSSNGKSSYKTITDYADGTQDVVESESEYKKKYDFAELEKAVKDAQEELLAVFPKEVTDCVKKKVKEGKKPAVAVKECWAEFKKVQDKAMATEVVKRDTIIVEKDNEIKNKNTELGNKDQEISELKAIKKEKEEGAQPSLDVGNVSSTDAYKTKRESIDIKAFGKKR